MALWGWSAGIARRSGEGAAWAAVRGTFACALGWSGGRRSAAGDHAASPRGPPPAGRPEGHPRCQPGRGAGPRGPSAGGGSTRRGRPGAHDRGERGSAAEKHPFSAARVRGGGLRPRRAPPRGDCLLGRARATWSAERFVGWLRRRGGGCGGHRIRWQVRGGVGRSGSESARCWRPGGAATERACPRGWRSLAA